MYKLMSFFLSVKRLAAYRGSSIINALRKILNAIFTARAHEIKNNGRRARAFGLRNKRRIRAYAFVGNYSQIANTRMSQYNMIMLNKK